MTATSEVTFRLMYLPANAAWAFLFGRDVATASIEPMDGERFFRSSHDARDAARRCGLEVRTSGEVFNPSGPCEACGQVRRSDPDFCDACLALMRAKRAELGQN